MHIKPEFNRMEFQTVRNKTGRLIMTPTQWIERMNAVGLTSKAGRYGGTYAHSDIAFEFASWVSLEFKLYLIKDFQRLKKDESERLRLGWDAKRELTKINYRIHTDAVDYTRVDTARDDLFYGVRPALHLNLSHTDVWTKGEAVTSEDKKTASTDSQPDGESTEEPTKTPTQTPTPTKTSDTPADTIQSTPMSPAPTTSLKVTNKKAGKTVVSFKKVSGAAGYQIQYAKNKKFTKAKKSKTTKKTTYTIKKLKKKTTYYFRVRAYVKDGNGDKVFGKWSAVKKLKIKR